MTAPLREEDADKLVTHLEESGFLEGADFYLEVDDMEIITDDVLGLTTALEGTEMQSLLSIKDGSIFEDLEGQ